MKQEEAFALFLRLPCVEDVQVTFFQGKIKHYNVFVRIEGCEAAEKLTNIWPFCTITGSRAKDAVTFDFLVRPDEVDAFYARLARVKFPDTGKNNKVALIFQLSRPATTDLKRRVEGSLRRDDRINWAEDKLAITLQTREKEAVLAVKRRVVEILGSHFEEKEIFNQQVV